MDVAKIFLCVMLFLVIVGLAVWMKMAVWHECRLEDHSVYYCWSLVGK